MLLLQPWEVRLVDVSKGQGTDEYINDDSGKLFVMTEDTPDSPTIYSDQHGSTVTETAGVCVLTFTNGVARFWTANTVTALDLSGITANGQAIGANSITPSNHRIPINPFHGAGAMPLAIPFQHSDAAETDTGIDIPANCMLSPWGVSFRIITTDSTETIDIGILSSETGGDADGLVVAASVGTAGFVNLIPQITGGTNIDYVSTNYIGLLLSTSIAGADAVATVGGWSPKRYRFDGTAKSITYTGSAGSDTVRGYVYLSLEKLPF